jgi:outer membrane lipoprotein-sorting protein
VNVFRRLPTPRLIALCVTVVALVAASVAVAGAVGSDPQPPPPRALPEAIHGALTAAPVQGVTARVELRNDLVDANGFEGISPLIAGGKGRLWWSDDGSFRLELQGNSGDVQFVVRKRAFWAYDGASNMAWRGTLPPERARERKEHHEGVPTVAQIEEKLAKVMKRTGIAGPSPGVEGGRPAYSVRLTPRRHAGLLGAVGLAWDAAHGTPLRVGIYAKGAAAPALELRATEVEYGPVDASAFDVKPPPGAELTDLGEQAAGHASRKDARPELGDLGFDLAAPDTLAGRDKVATRPAGKGAVVVYGKGLDALYVVQRPYEPKPAKKDDGFGHHRDGGQVELPTTDVNGARARVLDTPLGGGIEWSRDGVTYVVAGSAPRAQLEAAARGL